MLDGLLRRDHEEVGLAVGQRQGVEARYRGVGEQLGVVEEGELVGDGAEVGPAFLLADLHLALDRDVGQATAEPLGVLKRLRKRLRHRRSEREKAIDRLQRAPLRRLPEPHPGHIARDDGAGRLVEVPAVLVGAGTGRGEQGVEQDVDVADGVALVLADERQRVEGGAGDIRQVAVLVVLPVLGHHAEGIEEEHAAAHLPATPRGDAPELAARIDDHRGSVEPALVRREEVERDGGALSGAGRRDGDGRALEGPADERRVPPRAPLAEQDPPSSRQAAHGGPVQERGPAVEVGRGASAPIAAAEVLDAVDRRLAPEHGRHHDGDRRDDEHDQPESLERLEPLERGAERGHACNGRKTPVQSEAPDTVSPAP